MISVCASVYCTIHLTALIKNILRWDLPQSQSSSFPFQEMAGDRVSRLCTSSACSCGFKDLPRGCHVRRQRDSHCPKGLEWHLESRWGPLCGCAMLRLRHRNVLWNFLNKRAWTYICKSPDFDCLNSEMWCPWLLVGLYNLPDGVVLSVPVTFTDGKWSVLFEVTVGDELKERLQLSASELRQVYVLSYKDIVLNTYSHSSTLPF